MIPPHYYNPLCGIDWAVKRVATHIQHVEILIGTQLIIFDFFVVNI